MSFPKISAENAIKAHRFHLGPMISNCKLDEV